MARSSSTTVENKERNFPIKILIAARFLKQNIFCKPMYERSFISYIHLWSGKKWNPLAQWDGKFQFALSSTKILLTNVVASMEFGGQMQTKHCVLGFLTNPCFQPIISETDIFIRRLLTLISLAHRSTKVVFVGAHYPELPSSILTLWVSPVPYLFIFRNTSHGIFFTFTEVRLLNKCSKLCISLNLELTARCQVKAFNWRLNGFC